MVARLKYARNLKKAIRKNVIVGSTFVFGQRCVLWAPRLLTIGNDVSMGSDVRIEIDGSIGDGVLIASAVGIIGRTDHVLDEIGVTIRRARRVTTSPDELSRPTTIGSDVWIGYGAIILSGVAIGNSSVIGAGSVVTKDVPQNSIVVGNPGRVIGQRLSSEDFELHWRQLERNGVRRA